MFGWVWRKNHQEKMIRRKMIKSNKLSPERKGCFGMFEENNHIRENEKKKKWVKVTNCHQEEDVWVGLKTTIVKKKK